MNCINCGAALPPKSAVCKYCRTRNDVDLRALFDIGRHRPDESRHCPHCDEPLETIDLGLHRPFFLDRCTRCLGLFFDPGELREVVRSRTEEAERVDHTRLDRLLAEETPADFSEVRYVKCPTCRKLMNRRSHGTRAGVIVDECKDHGVWLDAGELRRILSWTRAGGPAHHAARVEERRRSQDRERAFRRMTAPTGHAGADADDDNWPELGGMLQTLIRMIVR
jgi:Zn-finger nucleic acid-binding protein